MLIIDRIEGDFAIIECGEITFNLPLAELPDGVSEGDCLKLTHDRAMTEERKKKIEQLMKKLTQK